MKYKLHFITKIVAEKISQWEQETNPSLQYLSNLKVLFLLRFQIIFAKYLR